MAKGLENITLATGALDPDTIYLIRRSRRRKGLAPNVVVANEKRDATAEVVAAMLQYIMPRELLERPGAVARRDLAFGSDKYRVTVEVMPHDHKLAPVKVCKPKTRNPEHK